MPTVASNVDEVGVGRERVLGEADRIVAVAHPLLGRQAEFLAIAVGRELAAILVADERQHRHVR